MRSVRLLIVIVLWTSLPIEAHPGRTDRSGCHTCRTNCHRYGLPNGEYHCHESRPPRSKRRSKDTSRGSSSKDDSAKKPEVKRFSWPSETKGEYQRDSELKLLWDSNSLHPPFSPPDSKASDSGRLFLWISAEDAVVYVDDQLLGIAQDIHQHATGISIQPGPRDILIFRPGFEIFRETLYVRPGQTTSLKVELVATRAVGLGERP